MKNRLLIVLVFFAMLPMAKAQKYAVVNTDYVLKSLPEYSSAQKRLDRYVADWQKELADKAAEIESMRANYEQESYLLPENLKKRRQEEIRAKEEEIRTLQQQHFGAGGDLDKRRAELLKPVQDRVFSVIERLASEKNFAMVFDKAGSTTVLYANKKYDISDDVLEQLGVKPGTATADKEQEGGKTADKTDKTTKTQEKKPKNAFKPSNPEMRVPNEKSQRSVMPPLGNSKVRQ